MNVWCVKLLGLNSLAQTFLYKCRTEVDIVCIQHQLLVHCSGSCSNFSWCLVVSFDFLFPSFHIVFFFAAGVEVVSIDAVVKKPNGVIIGITLIRVRQTGYDVH